MIKEKNLSEIKVSAIISTYNRYAALMNAIDSVKQQTHRNIEIIVINDKSEEYYGEMPNNIKLIQLEKNSREIVGFPCAGYVRNIGIAQAQGEYIAILDDDDIWMPEKTHIQLNAMVKNSWDMSCTEGYMGDSFYHQNKNYLIYHTEYYKDFCEKFFTKYYGYWTGMLPEVFDLQLIKRHNFIIHSSVILKKSLLDKVVFYKEVPNGVEDWDLWKRALEHTDCLNINKPLVYYDGRLSIR